MKKKISLIFFLLLSLFGLAQPIISATDFQNYSILGYKITNIDPINSGNSGPNVNWDFSNLTFSPTPFFSVNTVPVESAPFYNSFPSANYCEKLYFPSADYESYTIEKVDLFGIETLGVTKPENIIFDYSPNTRFTPLPLTYNTTYTDSYQSTTNSLSTTETFTYDAYGTLTTPFGTYLNVARIKRNEAGESTTRYSWYRTNPFQILLAGDFSIDGNANFYLYQNGVLNVNENLFENKIIISPNPSNGEFNITSAQQIDKIRIIDILGQEILTISPTSLATDIQMTNYNAGLYFVEIVSNNRETVKKILIK